MMPAASAATVAGTGTGSTEHLVFSHANGFPAGTYRVHMAAWRAAGFEVSAIARYAHEPRYSAHHPNWPRILPTRCAE